MRRPWTNQGRRAARLRPGRTRGAFFSCWGLLALCGLVAVVVSSTVLVQRWLSSRERRREWRALLERIAQESACRHGIAPSLVKAVIYQESRFRVLSRGRHGEVGLMQLTDGAVTDWENDTGLRCPSRGALFDPRLNVEIGTWYLARALRGWRDYRDCEVLALAQYNAGRRNVLKWAPENHLEKALDHVRFPSTRQYIVNVLKYRTSFERESL